MAKAIIKIMRDLSVHSTSNSVVLQALEQV